VANHFIRFLHIGAVLILLSDSVVEQVARLPEKRNPMRVGYVLNSSCKR
jgi:hypothetical protein